MISFWRKPLWDTILEGSISGSTQRPWCLCSERWVGIVQKLDEISLEPWSSLGRGLECVCETAVVIETSGRWVGSSLESLSARLSYLYLRLRKLTSHSPPGFTQTKASSRAFPVLVVGRTPKPVLMTLHQSPQASCEVGWTPFRACNLVSCWYMVAGKMRLTSVSDEMSRVASGRQ